MTDEFDPWELATGLPEKFKGVIQDSCFTFDSDYHDGDTCLLRLTVLTDDTEIGEAGETTLLYSCGTGWEPESRGEGVRREDGKLKPFQKQSSVGQLIEATRGAMGSQDAKARGNPMKAKYWRGLKFDWERKSYSGTFGDGKREWTRMLPVKWLGEVGSSGADGARQAAAARQAPAPSSVPNRPPEAPQTPQPAAEAPAAAEVPHPPPAPSGGMSSALRLALLKAAKAAPDHDSFIEAAFGLDGVMDNPEVEAAIMANGPDSLYARAKGTGG